MKTYDCFHPPDLILIDWTKTTKCESPAGRPKGLMCGQTKGIQTDRCSVLVSAKCDRTSPPRANPVSVTDWLSKRGVCSVARFIVFLSYHILENFIVTSYGMSVFIMLHFHPLPTNADVTAPSGHLPPP